MALIKTSGGEVIDVEREPVHIASKDAGLIEAVNRALVRVRAAREAKGSGVR